MAGIALQTRDLAATRGRLEQWFAQRVDAGVVISDLVAANRAAGWSSESLVFTADAGELSGDYVLRIPPDGGGIFPEYDLDAQAQTMRLLGAHGIPTPSPTVHEPDESWIGAKFLVMPRITGHTPSDTSYATRGWLHGAGATVQRRAHDSFLETLVRLHSVPIVDAPWLRRPTGVGLSAEIDWWQKYLEWGTDGEAPAQMSAAFDWLRADQPTSTAEPVVSWGDARMSNGIFDDAGQLVAALDWEQACICPAEADFGWWLATRKQMLEVNGLTADPELPGFDNRDAVIALFEQVIGRELVDLAWYEIFAMVRMGCCIVRMQSLLRRTGQTDHGFLKAPTLPSWVAAVVG